MSTQNKQAEPVKTHPNEGLGLERFDYTKMRGEMYHKYVDLVEGKVMNEDDPYQKRGGGLPDAMYVFEAWDVTPHRKRLYPRSTTDKTMIADGFELKSVKPKAVTKMFLRQATELNQQLYSLIAGFDGPYQILYYTLQQPKTK